MVFIAMSWTLTVISPRNDLVDLNVSIIELDLCSPYVACFPQSVHVIRCYSGYLVFVKCFCLSELFASCKLQWS